MKKIIFLLLFKIVAQTGQSQDTFSMLAFDSLSGEVGAVGASCVDLFNVSVPSNHFLAELFPGVGAIATQASYLPTNQANARIRMNAGDSPNQIISYLQNNDVGANPSVRQYGVVRMMLDSVQSAAFTGSNCLGYKNHVLGPNYSIQGNILLGQQVLDSMEARFLREPGDLACKLMAAMQGAKIVGADSRCANNNSSSLFAFIKVAQPTDTFGNPSFVLSLKTHSLAMIEPIDSLQKLFNAVRTCTNDWVTLEEKAFKLENWKTYPNPVSGVLFIEEVSGSNELEVFVYNGLGQLLRKEKVEFIEKKGKINLVGLENGVYYMKLKSKYSVYGVKQFVISRE